MIIVVTGPTCSGKSKLAIEIAQHFNGEIVNGDAFQVYEELDIGTAKPSNDDFKIVPHHLFSYIKPNEKYSIKKYQKDAREVIDDILKRNKVAVICGGSGLYIRAALYDYELPEENTVETYNFSEYTNEELYSKLVAVDPDEANKLHPNNRKRVERALSIFYALGKTKSDIISAQSHKPIYSDLFIFSTNMDRKELYERINGRVDNMIATGLVKEVVTLIEKYGKEQQAFSAIGYKEIINNLEMHTDDVKALIQKNTRNYAKRQITFIKHQFPSVFVQSKDEIVDYIMNNNINARSELLIGRDAVSYLNTIKVGIVGIGGVGGTVLESLVRSNINEFVIVDRDIVSATNLNRQILFNCKNVGEYKVDCAIKYVKSINPNAKIEAFCEFLDENNVDQFKLDECDYVVDAIDSLPSKKALIKYLLKNEIPFISSLGMGNKLDPEKLCYTKLSKTEMDPLAKKLRSELRKDGVDLSKINVVFSKEEPLVKSGTISSMIFVPSAAGLIIASNIIKELLENMED